MIVHGMSTIKGEERLARACICCGIRCPLGYLTDIYQLGKLKNIQEGFYGV
jgi:hypothetical protein